ncbi:MAG: FtsX-like permease family protein [Cellulosilyticaceae bacterium]
MYFKLAVNNVKKSFRDYGIYFLTLTFSVCIFYVFNTLESQRAMMIVSDTTDNMMKNLAELIGYLSFFIAIVLGFLILYANKFLIRRRKKELGLYMLMGMEKSKISMVLVLETFLIGLFSLGVGLGLGIFLSQALSVFTAKLFGAQMEQFRFVFSPEGVAKSVLCFVMIYVIVMVFNVLALSKSKLIELLYANKKNERPKVRSLKVAVVCFALAVICLVTAYVFIIKNGLQVFDGYFYAAFVLAFVGTLLFFMSLSGFLLKVMQSCKSLYYRELNMFIFRQINSKVNTTYISMTLICLMLAVTIVTLSSGMAVNQAMRNELEQLTPYDATFTWERNTREPHEVNVDVQEELAKINVLVEDYAREYATYTIYETDITYGHFYEGQDLAKQSVYLQNVSRQKVGAMTVSDYNRVLALQGLEPIALKADEYALNSIYSELITTLTDYLKNNEAIVYEGEAFKSPRRVPLKYSLYNQVTGMPRLVIILPDEAVNRERVLESIVSFNYKSADSEDQLMTQVTLGIENYEALGDGQDIYINGLSREMIYDASVGLSAIMTYLTIYVSLIFIITSAAILALGQLTEAEDNKVRYQLLRKLGIDEKVINRALFTQIAIYFMVPLVLAVIHGGVGIYVANHVIEIAGDVNVLASIIFTAIVFVVIYGAYFVGTYFSSKNVIK